MLTRVIEAPERRVVPVVGGDDAKVGGAHRRLDDAEPPIEGFETGRITGDVAAMSPFGVEIDQIDEDQAAFRSRLERIEQKVDIAVVAFALALVPGVAMGEDVADLADRDDGSASARRSLQNIAIGRRHGEILTIGGARKVLGARADEGAGDNAPDVQWIAQPACDPAEIIKPLESEGLLV